MSYLQHHQYMNKLTTSSTVRVPANKNKDIHETNCTHFSPRTWTNAQAQHRRSASAYVHQLVKLFLIFFFLLGWRSSKEIREMRFV